MKILVFVTDLMLMVKTEEMLKSMHADFQTLESADALPQFDWIILDLENPLSFQFIAKYPSKTICFCPHAETGLMEKASSLGCSHVYARGFFFSNLGKIVASLNAG